MDSPFKTDLTYLYSSLLKHPSLINNDEKRKEFDLLYSECVPTTCDYNSLVASATKLTCFFHDGHTNIEIPYTLKDYCLPIPCHWNTSGTLVLSRDIEGRSAGTQIVCVENTSIEELIQIFSARIPHENQYLVKSRMINYPYQNYHLFSQMNLQRLFGKKPYYKISLWDGIQYSSIDCHLQTYNGFNEFPSDEQALHYSIVDNTAILYLHTCKCDDSYKKALEEVAMLCAEQNIPTLILDLSKNMGGSSAVIDEFIRYVDIEHYRRYEMIDYTSGDPNYITKRTDVVCNQKAHILFPKNIFCKVSYDTFSSARTFAVTLKDNGIAKIIGNKTGGKPCSYGMPERLKMPNSNIPFRVSRCLFLRPDASKDQEITLAPSPAPACLPSI